MRVEEESGQLLAELRRLREQVADLSARVRDLEAGSGPAAPAAEEREGDFGPAIKRTTPARHQSAVNRALTMLGVIPPEAKAQTSVELTASHQHALEQMRRMGGDHDAPADAGEPAPAEGDLVPLPELGEELEHERDGRPNDPAPVELDGAIPIDLTRRHTRVRDLALLLVETTALGAGFILLPGPVGVLVALPLICAMALPQGYMRPALRAHARFLVLVVLARCLLLDVRAASVDTAWLNARFLTMMAACVPAFAVVFVGRIGWALMAVGLSVVAGAAVGAELGSPTATAAVAAAILGAVTLWRRLRR